MGLIPFSALSVTRSLNPAPKYQNSKTLSWFGHYEKLIAHASADSFTYNFIFSLNLHLVKNVIMLQYVRYNSNEKEYLGREYLGDK